ncbi:MAG: cell wall-binding repeat-containing protein [Dethiobacter sp.]|jgi:putative cell wall-binding protein|nr:cell wall-binding repeat-containing protein [Dethiobacter sp.]
MNRGLFVALLLISFVFILAVPTGLAQSGQVLVSVKSMEGGVGTIIEVPVEVTNPSGMAGGSIVVKYDPSIVEPVSARAGSLIGGFLHVANTAFTSDSIKVAWAGTSGKITDGVITIITFSLKSPGATALEITELSLIDAITKNIPSTPVNGSITVTGTAPAPGTPSDGDGEEPAVLPEDAITEIQNSAGGVYKFTHPEEPDSQERSISLKRDILNSAQAYNTTLSLDFGDLSFGLAPGAANVPAGSSLILSAREADLSEDASFSAGSALIRLAGRAYWLSAVIEDSAGNQSAANLQKYLNLSISAVGLSGIADPNNLYLERYDPVAAQWAYVPSFYNPQTGNVEASLPGLSYYRVVEYDNFLARLSGQDRIETGIAVSREAFKAGGSAGAVVLARSDNFPDALAGVPLAYAKNAPLLLTAPKALDSRVAVEIQRVLDKEGTVYLLGGTGALSAEINAALVQMGYQTVRLAGNDRYETAIKIAEALGSSHTEVFLATGENFPDALAASSAAAIKGIPVLLCRKDAVPGVVAQYLNQHQLSEVYVVGGTAAISAHVYTAAGGTLRLAAADRYGTTLEVTRHFFTAGGTVVIGTGLNFPDALTGGVLAAKKGAPVLLTAKETLPQSLKNHLGSSSLQNVYILGGPSAVSKQVLDTITTLLK